MRSSRSSISFSTASLNARWSANGGSTYQRMNRRRKSFTGPALPTIGRSAETAHSRSAWSRAESRTCAGVTSAAARAAGAHLLLEALEERRDVGLSPRASRKV